MLSKQFQSSRRLIEGYTIYECLTEEGDVEKELSFGVRLTKDSDRETDNFPAYCVPENKMVWLSDWSSNVTAAQYHFVDHSGAGGSLGRVTRNGEYVFVLNCAVRTGEMKIFSPSRPIRYLSGEWIAVCFHHLGYPVDLACRATLRFTEVSSDGKGLRTRYGDWSRNVSTKDLDEWLSKEFLQQPFREG